MYEEAISNLVRGRTETARSQAGSSVARITGRTISAVETQRKKWKVSKPDSKLRRWTPEEDKLLGTAPDETVAAKLGRTRIAVWARRMALGIRTADVRGPRISVRENARLVRPDPGVMRKLSRKISVPRSRLSAEDEERLRLVHGPYYPPDVWRGTWLICEWRGLTKVGGYSENAPIPWPYARRTGYRSLILCGDLVRAVRLESEQAIVHHWRVCHTTVGKWRQALGVEENNGGTLRVKLLAARKTGLPEIRRKISDGHWGKPSAMSPAGRRRFLAAQRKPKPKALRDKWSETWRRKYASGYKPRPWTDEEYQLLGTKPDREIARRLGRTVKAVAHRRFLLRAGTVKFGKPSFQNAGAATTRASWTKHWRRR